MCELHVCQVALRYIYTYIYYDTQKELGTTKFTLKCLLLCLFQQQRSPKPWQANYYLKVNHTKVNVDNLMGKMDIKATAHQLT